MSAGDALEPFTIAIPESALADLRERLQRTRLPDEPAGAGWSYGASLPYLRRLLRYWLTEYDWRAAETRLNRFRHFRARVDDYRIHFIHERGSGWRPLPLVITHGWPGSFVEFETIIEPLAHPERFGGSVEDAFDVVVPSLPGYAWSSPPPEPITTRDVARLWDTLMTSALGYPRYVAQGGDWGSLVTSWLGVDAAEHLAAIHVNMFGLRPYTGEGSPPPTAEDEAWMARARAQLRRETGYQAIQGTKPQTLAYALTDSPAGLAAWIVEKFHGWTDPGAAEPPFAMERLVTNVMIYWLTGCAGSASWLYTAARRKGGMALGEGEAVRVPTGFMACGHDLFSAPPDSWLRRAYPTVRRTELPAAGHFVAWQRPDEFVADVREFFRPFRRA